MTYGAGGQHLRKKDGGGGLLHPGHATTLPALAHLDLLLPPPGRKFAERLAEMKERGALRTSWRCGATGLRSLFPGPYTYAIQLIQDIKAQGDFCVGGACYPEGHVECPHKEDDIYYLKEKVEAGCDFLTTQMFFDNNVYYNFLYRVLAVGIKVPVIPGIMPVINAKQVKRSAELSGAMMPPRFLAIADKFADDPLAMEQAGIAYATDQIIDLVANGVRHIHLYTMNRPKTAAKILENLSHILR